MLDNIINNPATTVFVLSILITLLLVITLTDRDTLEKYIVGILVISSIINGVFWFRQQGTIDAFIGGFGFTGMGLAMTFPVLDGLFGSKSS
jgi:hypothetical protein